MRVAIIRRGRNPFEVWLQLAAIIGGLAFFTGLAPAPNSLEQTLPLVVRYSWYGILLAGGVVSLAGVNLPDIVDSVSWERIGLYLLAGGAFAYAFTLIYFAGGQAATVAIPTAAVGVASAVRIRQIGKDMRRAVAKMEEASE